MFSASPERATLRVKFSSTGVRRNPALFRRSPEAA